MMKPGSYYTSNWPLTFFSGKEDKDGLGKDLVYTKPKEILLYVGHKKVTSSIYTNFYFLSSRYGLVWDGLSLERVTEKYNTVRDVTEVIADD